MALRIGMLKGILSEITRIRFRSCSREDEMEATEMHDSTFASQMVPHKK
jgi:hypothetical protein